MFPYPAPIFCTLPALRFTVNVGKVEFYRALHPVPTQVHEFREDFKAMQGLDGLQRWAFFKIADIQTFCYSSLMRVMDTSEKKMPGSLWGRCLQFQS